MNLPNGKRLDVHTVAESAWLTVAGRLAMVLCAFVFLPAGFWVASQYFASNQRTLDAIANNMGKIVDSVAGNKGEIVTIRSRVFDTQAVIDSSQDRQIGALATRTDRLEGDVNTLFRRSGGHP